MGLASLNAKNIGCAFNSQFGLVPATQALFKAGGNPGAQLGQPQQLVSVVPVVKHEPALTPVHAQSCSFVVFPTVV